MGVKKLPRGLSLRADGTLQLSFQYQGSQCREPLSNYNPDLKSDLTYLSRLRSEILRRIADKTFKYADYFPNSPRLQRYGGMKSDATVLHFIEARLSLDKTARELATSTLKGYTTCKNRLAPLHNIPIRLLDVSHIANFVGNLVRVAPNQKDSRGTLRKKTIVDTLVVLNKALKLAITQKHRTDNPLEAFQLNDYVSVKRSRANKDEVDPFSPEEIVALINAMPMPEVKNYYILRFYSGVTVSECNALTWDDIDFFNKKIRVRAAFVEGELKDTKVEGRDRLIDLEEDGVAALVAQKAYTFLQGGYVFINPVDGKPFMEDQALRKTYWIPALRKSGIRYRPPKQTRHTYACMMISQGRNLWWLKTQLGHSSLKMLEQHYGSFMKAFQDVFSKVAASSTYESALSLYRTSI